LSTLTYARLVEELFPRLTGGIRWGLERTERLLASVGNPHHTYPVIHVGGTNGKGSVSATVSSILRAHNLRTGLYTSPHLCTFRERIQVDGVAIGEDALLRAAEKLWPAIESEEASFFEATTAIGFLALAQAEVDIAVIEVGLGGRLDSTNVVQPLVSVITNISLDHVQLLGNTIEAVAREKAGILKRGVPCVTGEVSGIAADVLREHATAAGASLETLGRDDIDVASIGMDGTTFRMRNATEDLHSPLIGAHQAWNAALAVRAVSLLPSPLRPHATAIRDGVSAVTWPGRLQVEAIGGRPWIFDVAHNVAGVAALVAALDGLDLPRPRTVVVGVLGDKDWAGMLAPLRAWADDLIVTAPPTAPSDRRWDLDRVFATFPGRRTRMIADFGAALRAAHDADAGCVVITGSFHTVGDALDMLGRCPFGSDAGLPRIDFGG
jgi:dihydrofolate synthase/folylpolyglutamate synthase